MKISKTVKFIGCIGLTTLFLTGCSSYTMDLNESNNEIAPIINLTEQELEKYDVIDVLNIDSKVTKVDDEEAIVYTLKYKNTSDKELLFEPSLGILTDSYGGFTGPDDGYVDRFNKFLEKRGLDIEEVKDSDFSEYEDEFLEETSFTLEPNQEVVCSFTIKKSEILLYFDSKTDKNVSIEELLSNSETALNYCCMYKLDDEKYVSIEYIKYPDKEVQKNGYIDSYK